MTLIYLVKNIYIIKINTETLLLDSRETGLGVNEQIAGQNHGMNVANRSFESVIQCKYLGVILTDQNYMQEEIKRR
jgi:hypothetical protein